MRRLSIVLIAAAIAAVPAPASAITPEQQVAKETRTKVVYSKQVRTALRLARFFDGYVRDWRYVKPRVLVMVFVTPEGSGLLKLRFPRNRRPTFEIILY